MILGNGWAELYKDSYHIGSVLEKCVWSIPHSKTCSLTHSHVEFLHNTAHVHVKVFIHVFAVLVRDHDVMVDVYLNQTSPALILCDFMRNVFLSCLTKLQTSPNLIMFGQWRASPSNRRNLFPPLFVHVTGSTCNYHHKLAKLDAVLIAWIHVVVL